MTHAGCCKNPGADGRHHRESSQWLFSSSNRRCWYNELALKWNYLITAKNGLEVLFYCTLWKSMVSTGLEGGIPGLLSMTHSGQPTGLIRSGPCCTGLQCPWGTSQTSKFCFCRLLKPENWGDGNFKVLLCHIRISQGNQTRSMQKVVVQVTVPWQKETFQGGLKPQFYSK